MNDIAINELRQREYNGASDDSPLPKAFKCLKCKDAGVVHPPVEPFTHYWQKLVPCPTCRPADYDRWVGKNGVPPTMPKWVEG